MTNRMCGLLGSAIGFEVRLLGVIVSHGQGLTSARSSLGQFGLMHCCLQLQRLRKGGVS